MGNYKYILIFQNAVVVVLIYTPTTVFHASILCTELGGDHNKDSPSAEFVINSSQK